MQKRKKQVPQRGRRLGREAWILVAKEALIEGGLEAVKIDRLAKTLQAERGSFYHHFENRDALLAELLQHWEVANTRAYEEAIDTNSHDGEAELEKINTMWLEEKTFDPAYDSAMRDWARIDRQVARVVRRVDERRIGILEKIYRDLGYEGNRALVQARVAYFHQVGYLTLGLGETRKRRRELAPIYLDVLLGR